MTSTRATSTRKPARSPSPAPATAATPKAKKSPKPRAASSSKKKKDEEKAKPEDVTVAKSETKKRVSRKKEVAPAPIEDEEILSDFDDEAEATAVIFIDEDMKEGMQLIEDAMKDKTGVHNVVRVQYVQQYVRGVASIASALSPSVPALPMLVGTTDLVRGLFGCLCLAHAFTLTAVAQASFSAMKKSLQYDMFFHLILAFIVILKQDPKMDPRNTMFVVGLSCVNVALSLWACYYRNNDLPEDDEEDEE